MMIDHSTETVCMHYFKLLEYIWNFIYHIFNCILTTPLKNCMYHIDCVLVEFVLLPPLRVRVNRETIFGKRISCGNTGLVQLTARYAQINVEYQDKWIKERRDQT